jgi:hypothetical protein
VRIAVDVGRQSIEDNRDTFQKLFLVQAFPIGQLDTAAALGHDALEAVDPRLQHPLVVHGEMDIALAFILPSIFISVVARMRFCSSVNSPYERSCTVKPCQKGKLRG